MEYIRTRTVVPRLEILTKSPSTNDALMRAQETADASAWPEFSTMVTENQTAGKGRLGRVWASPPGTSLAISVILRPRRGPGASVPLARFGWLSLVAGLAMTRAVRNAFSDEAAQAVTLKWPNDVLISGRKVSGILSELSPDAETVVIGAGLNLALTPDQLPVPHATSLLIAGAHTRNPDSVLADYLEELQTVYRRFRDASGDPESSGLLAEVTEVCGTLGSPVRVELPSGGAVEGVATSLSAEGQLVVQRSDGTGILTVAAGDITHLRQ